MIIRTQRAIIENGTGFNYIKDLNICHDNKYAVTYLDTNGKLYYFGNKIQKDELHWKNLFTNETATEYCASIYWSDVNKWIGMYVADEKLPDGKVMLIDSDMIQYLNENINHIEFAITTQEDINKTKECCKNDILKFEMNEWLAYERIRVSYGHNKKWLVQEAYEDGYKEKYKYVRQVECNNIIAVDLKYKKAFDGKMWICVKSKKPNTIWMKVYATEKVEKQFHMQDVISFADEKGYLELEPFEVDEDICGLEIKLIIIANRKIAAEIYDQQLCIWTSINDSIKVNSRSTIKLRLCMQYGDVVSKIALANVGKGRD